MSNGYFDFLDQNSTPAASEEGTMKEEFVNLTLRADAECQVTCDGDFLVLLNPNQITKEKAPVGQHILQFISTEHPNIQVEKVVDFPDAGKNYLVLVNEFSDIMKELKFREQEEEIRRRQEQAKREAELAKMESERIKAEAENAKVVEALDAERRRAEELEQREAEECRQKEIQISELNAINFIEKYLQKVVCSVIDIHEEFEYYIERDYFNFEGTPFCYKVTKATASIPQQIRYVIKEEYDSIDILQAVEQEILPAIRIGNPQAMFVYSIFLVGNIHGASTFIKKKDALNYLLQSIKLGCVEATAYWGSLLLDTVESVSNEAEEWTMRQLDEQGEYFNYVRGFLEKSAIAGYVDSYFWLVCLYMSGNNGIMTRKEKEYEAYKLCQSAAAKGCFSAIICYAYWLSDAKMDETQWFNARINRPTVCPYDDTKALQLYLSAVDMCETREEIHRLLNSVPIRMYYAVLKCACDKGLCDALEEGLSYYSCAQGSSEPYKSRCYEWAVALYRLSADTGKVQALTALADCYFDGNGVCQSHEEALRLYKLSAIQNDSWAQYKLGICYFDGLGCDVDYDEANKWFKQAVVNGEKRAQEYIDKLP